MLRFPLFTEGRTWTDDYGEPEDPVQFRNLLGYSPYHNIRAGKAKGDRDYPAILVTTADTDDRVVPGHSFKYAAALQAAAKHPGIAVRRIAECPVHRTIFAATRTADAQRPSVQALLAAVRAAAADLR